MPHDRSMEMVLAATSPGQSLPVPVPVPVSSVVWPSPESSGEEELDPVSPEDLVELPQESRVERRIRKSGFGVVMEWPYIIRAVEAPPIEE